jgi:16S rRNA (adenine1518-N6/adenine1519-N6)-dimethyltransferase
MTRERVYPRPRKRFGQHFLEPAWVNRLVSAITPHPSDLFVEIGPGRGALTRALAPRVERLIAVEIDRDLAAALPSSVPANVRVVEGDFLSCDLTALALEAGGPLRVAGNLPYNVSSPIIFKLLQSAGDGATIPDATLMLQKEVAERVVAAPGSRDHGVLALQVALRSDAEILFGLPPGAFRPPPKVESAVVRLRFRPPPCRVDDAMFERIVRGIFLQRRKTLRNALAPVAKSFDRSAADVIERAGADPRARPEDLTVSDIARLCAAML